MVCWWAKPTLPLAVLPKSSRPSSGFADRFVDLLEDLVKPLRQAGGNRRDLARGDPAEVRGELGKGSREAVELRESRFHFGTESLAADSGLSAGHRELDQGVEHLRRNAAAPS